MTTALFDKDGVCVVVSDHPPRQPPGGAKAEVPAGTRPGDIWWDGEAVRQVDDAEIEMPEIVDQNADTVRISLPPGTVADVNGKRHRGQVTISTKALGHKFVDIRGARRGDFRVSVVDYAGRRRKAYPSTADQLDTIFHQGVDVWREQVQAVKDRYPKP
jgi:hypothetical protein